MPFPRSAASARLGMEARRIRILDGGLATELEARGFDLAHPLWSARLVLEEPRAILEVHTAYLAAGADVIVSSGYQAWPEGFRRFAGVSRERSRELYLDTLRIARRARELHGDPQRLVAASIGPYGAAQADGSEYRGHYGVSEEVLTDFHRERIELLRRAWRAGEGPDLVAVETLPSLTEARIVVGLLDELLGLPAWVSFTGAGGRTAEGEDLAGAGELLASTVVALGVNCVAPEDVAPALERLARACDLPRVAYPNSGERWDARRHAWSGTRGSTDSELVLDWVRRGVRWIGGCCRTGPADTARLAALRPVLEQAATRG